MFRDIARTKNARERTHKGHSNIGWKLFVGQTPFASQSPNRLVDRSSAWRQRLILEAWHSVRDRNVSNEHNATKKYTITLRIVRAIRNTLETVVTLKEFLRDLVLSHTLDIYKAGRRYTFAFLSLLKKVTVVDLQIAFFGHAQQRSCFQVPPSLWLFCQQFHRY